MTRKLDLKGHTYNLLTVEEEWTSLGGRYALRPGRRCALRVLPAGAGAV